ncbi:MAG: hypothetical protein U9R54_03745, partial [Bacteroidota bacterium]|nr:hypothetical protein [Bacteroidota bacterium]
LAYHLRKDKTKYRGFFKNKIWAILRSLWINFVRISDSLVKISQKVKINVNYTLHFGNITNFITFLVILTHLKLHRKLKFEIY